MSSTLSIAQNRQNFQHRLFEEEGSIAHMYCDSRGYVTVGVGHLLANADVAAQLPFIDKDSGQSAAREDIIGAYNRVKSEYQPDANWSAGHYKNVTKLILTEAVIEQLLAEKIDEFEQGLKAKLPDFPQYPDSAKMALLDMAFNLGLSGLFNKFPTLTHAVQQQDWANCARECHRRGISESRNAATEQLFIEATENNV